MSKIPLVGKNEQAISSDLEGSPFLRRIHTVDGNPAPVDTGLVWLLSHYVQGSFHSGCCRTSSINNIIATLKIWPQNQHCQTLAHLPHQFDHVFVHDSSTISPGSTFLPEQWGRSWGIIAYNPWSKGKLKDETLQSHDSINCFRHSFLGRFSALLAHKPPAVGRWWTQRTRSEFGSETRPQRRMDLHRVYGWAFHILFTLSRSWKWQKSLPAFGGNKIINRCAPKNAQI